MDVLRGYLPVSVEDRGCRDYIFPPEGLVIAAVGGLFGPFDYKRSEAAVGSDGYAGEVAVGVGFVEDAAVKGVLPCGEQGGEFLEIFFM